MAEIFLSHVVTEILKKLQSVVSETITGAWGLKGDLKKLSESAGRLQSLLKKVQYVQAVEDDESIKCWLEKLQEVVYTAVDVVDKFRYEILRRKVEMKGKVREFVSGNNHVIFRVKMAYKVKEVSESLAVMEKEAPPVLLGMIVQTIAAVEDRRGVGLDSLPDRRTDSFLGQRPIGRTKEAERIIQMLQVISTDAPRFTVISLVGFGGIGKTTLAQLIFEEVKKNNLFDEMMWVCVSEPFDAQKILGEMLEKLDKTTGGLRGIDVIMGELQNRLKDKRFLLVLDDVWNKESATWDTLKTRLEIICGKSGNYVIATTRGSDVANVMQSKHVEKLKELSDEECWNIIKTNVVEISWEMEVIGRNIANKCGGVPLAAKVIGGVLSSRNSEAEWLSIRDNDVWNEGDEDKRILGVLKLSFDHLPQLQKLCFAYCSRFPKDVVFDKAQLIQVWMAEDFFNTTPTSEGTRAKLMEDVGEECFRSLHANSFFQDAEVDDLGNIVGCKMHDLLHDLASSVSKSLRLQCRRLSFSCDPKSKVKDFLKVSEKKTRDFRCLFCKVDDSSLLSNFRRLRSLDMSDAKLKDLPYAIKKLKLLRYLDISKNESIEELSESITKLYNLQTLRVFKCKNLKELPSKIRNLVSLRHLEIDDKRLMPLEVGCLTDLQTLPFFVVGVENGQKIDELEGLKELRGELVICGLENVKDKEEAERARMKVKKLSKLVLQWKKVNEENFSSCEESKHEEVMGGLEAPTNIQSVAVKWYMGKELPKWMHELYKLEMLTLKDCRRCERMPTLGHLPNLKLLRVERMDSVTCIGTELFGDIDNTDNFFPSLEAFFIKEMENLVEWVIPEGREIFPKLLKLVIADCPLLQTCPPSQLISSPLCMQLDCFASCSGGYSLDILCNINIPLLEDFQIRNCHKVTFPLFGLTSLLSLNYYLGGISRLEKRFPVSYKELGECWKGLGFKGCVEGIREFPQSLEALEIEGFDGELSLEAFNGLTYLKHLTVRYCASLESIPNLSSLTSLEHLEIERCNLVKSIPTLSYLTSLKHLQIKSCESLESISNLSSLTSLKHLEIDCCDSLVSIPTLSSLTSLAHLEIEECHLVKSIPTLSSLTSLKNLGIKLCPSLVSISTLSSLTSLQHLQIGNCHLLVSIPTLSSLTSLEHLQIANCGNLESIPNISSLKFLKELSISGCNNLTSVPDGLISCQSINKLVIDECCKLSELWSDSSFSRLTCLEELSISKCGNLRSLPSDIKSCTSLKVLKVAFCEKMVSIEDDIIGSLAQLKKLKWGGFSKELDEIPGLNSMHLLSSLEEVKLLGWSKLTSLPHQLQHLTSVSELKIQRFREMKSLPDWLSNLSSLQTLVIWDCNNLKSLPADMQRLSKLTKLRISCCPLLKERHTKNIGPEWSNISHIPRIYM